MNDDHGQGPQLPPDGTAVTLPIFQSATRTTLFAEGAIVGTASPDALELVFVRSELLAVSQTGLVVGTDEERGAQIEIKGVQLQSVTQDIGHVRMALDAALDLAFSVLVHANQKHGIDHQALLERLQMADLVSK